MQTSKKNIRLLFVCLGNICRSPAAEGIMKRIVDKNELQDIIEVDSAGTSGWHKGDLPDERVKLEDMTFLVKQEKSERMILTYLTILLLWMMITIIM